MSLLPLPSPPTDNLYKFMAITGVILFVGAPIYWETFYPHLVEKETAFEVAVGEAQLAIGKLRKVGGPLPLPARHTEQPSPGVTDDAWLKQRETVEARMKELRLAYAQYVLFQDMGDRVRDLSIISWFVGAGVGTLGFLLWFRRVQRFQDQLIRREVERAKDESA